MGHETPTLAHLFTPGPFQTDVGPLQHDEVDIGDELPVRCLKRRRSAQFQIERGGGTVLEQAAVDGAIEEMVFAGGVLNLKRLGAAGATLET